MSLMKYRVHEIGKDFNVSSKDIMELLAPHFEGTKNHMTALTEEELSYIFEYYTQTNAGETFEEYFKVSPEKQAEKAAEVVARQTAEDEKKVEAPKVRYVDTKTVDVNLGKYDDKMEELVPDKVKDAGSEKQKIKKLNPNQNTLRPNLNKPNQNTLNHRANQSNAQNNNNRFNQNNNGRFNPNNRFNSNNRFGKITPKKETEEQKIQRLALERAKTLPLTVNIPEEISVGELALRLKKTNADVVKKLMALGVMASTAQMVDFDTASLVADEFNAIVAKEVIVTIEERLIDDSEDDPKDLLPRNPVVVVMGHVDHGKTSLLDAIKHTKVTETEAGGITQHIGAYRVPVNGREITFLDTPGHEAFTAMRLRGAQATDIAILVVAADDGIMPQTVEAISHAKAAGVSIIVAINKMDKQGANPEKIKQQLTEHELVVEDWGGDTICVPVSALTGEGIDNLLEMVMLTADMKELRANPNRAARGMVIEARLDKGRGPIATVLVQNGTLNQGDIILAGTATGRVRIMTDDKGRKIKSAGPSVPVEVVGLADVPIGGELFYAVADEKMARELADERRANKKEERFNSVVRVSLDDLFSQIQDGKIQDLNLIVKADVQGSVEAVKSSVEKLSTDEIRVKVIHGAVGAISSSDVMLASSANAIVVGFNVRPDTATLEEAQREDVQIKTYRVIYECIEELEEAMKGMLAPKFREVVLGHCEIRQAFKVTGVGIVAGCYVLDGKIARNASIRLLRDGIVLTETTVDTLKRFKDDAKEVAAGYECGVTLEKCNDIKEGDILEAFVMEEIKK